MAVDNLTVNDEEDPDRPAKTEGPSMMHETCDQILDEQVDVTFPTGADIIQPKMRDAVVSERNRPAALDDASSDSELDEDETAEQKLDDTFKLLK